MSVEQNLPFQKVQHRVDTVDSQPSNEQGAILVLVTGALMVGEENAREICSSGGIGLTTHAD